LIKAVGQSKGVVIKRSFRKSVSRLLKSFKEHKTLIFKHSYKDDEVTHAIYLLYMYFVKIMCQSLSAEGFEFTGYGHVVSSLATCV